MASVIFHFATVEVDLNTGPDIRNITDDLNRIIGRSGIEKGQATACIVGSTGSLTTIEYEPGVVQDLKDAINRAGTARPWPTPTSWPGTTATVTAMFRRPFWDHLSPYPFAGARLMLGTWQQVVAVNHDNRSRRPNRRGHPVRSLMRPVIPHATINDSAYCRPAIPITLSLMAGIIMGQGLPGFAFRHCSSCWRLPSGWSSACVGSNRRNGPRCWRPWLRDTWPWFPGRLHRLDPIISPPYLDTGYWRIHGVVVDPPVVSFGRTRAVLDVTSLAREDVSQRVRGRIRLTVMGGNDTGAGRPAGLSVQAPALP